MKHSTSSSKHTKRFQVIMPIAVSATSPQEAIAKVKAMLDTGYYNGKFLKYAPVVGASDPEVKELSF